MPVVSAYLDFLPAPLLARLLEDAEPVPAVPGLRMQAGLREAFPRIETDTSLQLVCEVARSVRPALASVLEQRKIDREFLDARVAECHAQARASGTAWGAPSG